MGDCYEKAGKLASAWGAYFDAISLGRRQGKPEYEDFAQKKKDELEPKLLKMTIVVPPDVKLDGMKVTRDGVVVEPAAWGVPSAVDPGKHVIEVTAPHKLAFHTERRRRRRAQDRRSKSEEARGRARRVAVRRINRA